MLAVPSWPVHADSEPAELLYSCDGTELKAVINPGAVDAIGIHIQHLAIEEVRQIFGLPV